jgi:drug/metabolite transporter superfamily protein YnfA
MKTALFTLGAVLAAFGVLFALQGAGIVRWPAESFMVDTRGWIGYGLVIALAGAALMLAARRLRLKGQRTGHDR